MLEHYKIPKTQEQIKKGNFYISIDERDDRVKEIKVK